jgi:hypothetical protein
MQAPPPPRSPAPGGKLASLGPPGAGIGLHDSRKAAHSAASVLAPSRSLALVLMAVLMALFCLSSHGLIYSAAVVPKSGWQSGGLSRSAGLQRGQGMPAPTTPAGAGAVPGRSDPTITEARRASRGVKVQRELEG